MNELELYHYGVKGMKWGVRRYRNADGSLTDAGKKKLYKSLRKHSTTQSGRLGGAVDKDPVIMEAARKALPAAKKSEEAFTREYALERKMREKELAKRDRLDKEFPDKTYDNMRQAEFEVRYKYGTQLNKLRKQNDAAYNKYHDTVDKIVDDYLGKYGDKRINSGLFDTQITAGRELAHQIIWGIKTGRVKDE